MRIIYNKKNKFLFNLSRNFLIFKLIILIFFLIKKINYFIILIYIKKLKTKKRKREYILNLLSLNYNKY